MNGLSSSGRRRWRSEVAKTEARSSKPRAWLSAPTGPRAWHAFFFLSLTSQDQRSFLCRYDVTLDEVVVGSSRKRSRRWCCGGVGGVVMVETVRNTKEEVNDDAFLICAGCLLLFFQPLMPSVICSVPSIPGRKVAEGRHYFLGLLLLHASNSCRSVDMVNKYFCPKD